MSVLIKAPFLRPYPLGLSQKPIALLPITTALFFPFPKVEFNTSFLYWSIISKIITLFTCSFERTDNGYKYCSVESKEQHWLRRQCNAGAPMIPISILGQPTKDDLAEGKRGERGKIQNRHYSYSGMFHQGFYQSSPAPKDACRELYGMFFPHLWTNTIAGSTHPLRKEKVLTWPLIKDYSSRLKTGYRDLRREWEGDTAQDDRRIAVGGKRRKWSNLQGRKVSGCYQVRPSLPKGFYVPFWDFTWVAR